MNRGRTKRKISPPAQLLLILSIEIVSHSIAPVKMIIAPPYKYLGAIIMILGIAINIWADALFKKNKTTVKPDGKPAKLISSGPFRISRNPMYLGMVAILLGVAVFLGSLISFIFPFIFFMIIDRKIIPTEEKIMAKEFGRDYLKYKKKIRKWV